MKMDSLPPAEQLLQASTIRMTLCWLPELIRGHRMKLRNCALKWSDVRVLCYRGKR